MKVKQECRQEGFTGFPDRPVSPFCCLVVCFLHLVSELHSPSCPVDGNDVIKTLFYTYFNRRKYWCHNNDVVLFCFLIIFMSCELIKLL